MVNATGEEWKDSHPSTHFTLKILWGTTENGMEEGAGNPAQKSLEIAHKRDDEMQTKVALGT